MLISFYLTENQFFAAVRAVDNLLITPHNHQAAVNQSFGG
jgi:hypothetical protein